MPLNIIDKNIQKLVKLCFKNVTNKIAKKLSFQKQEGTSHTHYRLFKLYKNILEICMKSQNYMDKQNIKYNY